MNALMSSAWFVVGLAVFAAGLFLLVLGLRGLRIGDHPHCRWCGFNLHGLDALSAVCPECGADRTRKGAVRIGKRKRRPIVSTLGAFLLIASISLSGVLMWGRATQFDWNTIKPAWLLLQEARSANAPTREAALTELFSRKDAGNLHDQSRHDLFMTLLDIQADRAVPWQAEWGDAIYQAYTAGSLDEKAYKRFLEQAIVFDFEIRPQVRKGTALPMWLRYETRAASALDLWLTVERSLLLIGETDYTKRGWGGESWAPFGDNGGSGHSIRVEEPLGQHEVRGKWKVSVASEYLGEAIHSWTLELSSLVAVVDESGDPITMLPDADLHADIAERTSVNGVRVRDADSEGRRWTDTMVNFRELPINVGFDVYWRIGEEEWLVGTATIGAMRGSYSFGCHEGLEGLPDEVNAVTVVLRASKEAARRTIDLTEIWDGELVFEDVPVESRPAFGSQ